MHAISNSATSTRTLVRTVTAARLFELSILPAASRVSSCAPTAAVHLFLWQKRLLESLAYGPHHMLKNTTAAVVHADVPVLLKTQKSAWYICVKTFHLFNYSDTSQPPIICPYIC